jgi:hypothetical protein
MNEAFVNGGVDEGRCRRMDARRAGLARIAAGARGASLKDAVSDIVRGHCPRTPNLA